MFVACGVAVLVVGGLLTFASGRRVRFYSGIIHGITGELGGGKSYFVVSKILAPAARQIASRRGLWCEHSNRRVRRIITNFTFRPEAFGINGCEVVQLHPRPDATIWEQLAGLATPQPDGSFTLDAIVAIDEMSLFAPSDEHRLDPVAKAIAVHIRKMNAALYWLAQDHMQVHKRVRALSHRIWFVRNGESARWMFLPGRWFTASAWKAAQVESNGPRPEPIEKRAVRATKRGFRAYESFEVITDDLDALLVLHDLAGRDVPAPGGSTLPPPAEPHNGWGPTGNTFPASPIGPSDSDDETSNV